ncbi:MAG: nuclear transport factor 2 family protein [Dokdonella sp.]
MSQSHIDLLSRYFGAFQRRDGNAMASCYHVKATFNDPAFSLERAEIGAMWRMLCSRSTDLRVEFSDLRADAMNGSADWQAWYTFSSTRRAVHNVVQSNFRFADGLIIEQVDTFDFWRWSRQALGPVGVVLGWSTPLRNKVRKTARKSLDRFIASECDGAG